MVNKISQDQFSKVESSKVAVVDFSATWCGPCKMIAPVIEELSESYGDKVNFFNIDVDDNPVPAVQFNVQSIPTILVFVNGEVVERTVGFQPAESLKGFIDPYVD